MAWNGRVSDDHVLPGGPGLVDLTGGEGDGVGRGSRTLAFSRHFDGRTLLLVRGL